MGEEQPDKGRVREEEESLCRLFFFVLIKSSISCYYLLLCDRSQLVIMWSFAIECIGFWMWVLPSFSKSQKPLNLEPSRGHRLVVELMLHVQKVPGSVAEPDNIVVSLFPDPKTQSRQWGCNLKRRKEGVLLPLPLFFCSELHLQSWFS